MIRQPEIRAISQEQLVAEVKGIYVGLVMVEGKCIQVDTNQAALAREAPDGTQPKLNNEQWQALIALHRTLLHEHHDFFLASQHPSATPAVRRLAIKYAMPARLWRHGIHSFLELLRNRLPDSLDHMLAFIYLAYSMMTLLFETVPAFEDTWIECLGDLGRYRMAIEDDDIRDREVWTQVSRQWYLKASDRTPKIGRLYHHLAILARPNALQQLFFYGKALSVSQPFPATKDSILTLFEPILSGKQMLRLPPVITAYVKCHAFLFMRNDPESFYKRLAEFISLLDGHISQVTQRFLEQGYYIGISNCFALLSYGSPDGLLSKALSIPDLEHMASTNMTAKDYKESPAELFKEALQLFVQTLKINCKRVGDPNVLSFLHVTLVFLAFISQFPHAMRLLENEIHWEPLVSMLNALLRLYHFYPRIEGDELPIPEKNDFRPTPEEFAMRGLEWAASYFPANWFENKNIEEENRYKEDASMSTDYRPERILWLGCRLAKSGKYIVYKDQKFSMPESVDTVMELTTPCELELDPGYESTTDTATLMADCDDAEGHKQEETQGQPDGHIPSFFCPGVSTHVCTPGGPCPYAKKKTAIFLQLRALMNPVDQGLNILRWVSLCIHIGYIFAARHFLQDAEVMFALVDELCKDRLVNEGELVNQYNKALEPLLMEVDLLQSFKYTPTFSLLPSALSSISSFFNRKPITIKVAELTKEPDIEIDASPPLCPECGSDLTLDYNSIFLHYAYFHPDELPKSGTEFINLFNKLREAFDAMDKIKNRHYLDFLDEGPDPNAPNYGIISLRQEENTKYQESEFGNNATRGSIVDSADESAELEDPAAESDIEVDSGASMEDGAAHIESIRGFSTLPLKQQTNADEVVTRLYSIYSRYDCNDCIRHFLLLGIFFFERGYPADSELMFELAYMWCRDKQVQKDNKGIEKLVVDAERIYQTSRLPSNWFTLKGRLTRILTTFQRDLTVKGKPRRDCPSSASFPVHCSLCDKGSAPYLNIFIHVQICHPDEFPKDLREFWKFIRDIENAIKEACKPKDVILQFMEAFISSADDDVNAGSDSDATLCDQDVEEDDQDEDDEQEEDDQQD